MIVHRRYPCTINCRISNAAAATRNQIARRETVVGTFNPMLLFAQPARDRPAISC